MTNPIVAVELLLTVTTWTPDKMLYPMGGAYKLSDIQVREQMGYATQLVARCETSLGTRDFVITNYPGPMLSSWRYRAAQQSEIQRLEDSNNVAQGMAPQSYQPQRITADIPASKGPPLPEALK